MRQTLTALMVFALLLPAAALAAGNRVAANQTTQATETNSTDKITAIEDLKRGNIVTVQGTVQRILDTDEFRLADNTGDIKVYIGWRNFVPVDVGDKVTVRGFVDDGLFLEIYAREIIHSDGRVTMLHQNS